MVKKLGDFISKFYLALVFIFTNSNTYDIFI